MLGCHSVQPGWKLVQGINNPLLILFQNPFDSPATCAPRNTHFQAILKRYLKTDAPGVIADLDRVIQNGCTVQDWLLAPRLAPKSYLTPPYGASDVLLPCPSFRVRAGV